MGIFDRIKNTFSGSEKGNEAYEEIIHKAYQENEDSLHWDVRIAPMDVYIKEVKKWPDEKKLDFMLYCVKRIKWREQQGLDDDLRSVAHNKIHIQNALVTQLLKTKLLLQDTDVLHLQEAFCQHKPWANINNWPINYLLNQIKKQYAKQELSPIMLKALKNLRAEMQKDIQVKEAAKSITKIDELIFAAENDATEVQPIFFTENDRLAKYANDQIKALPKDQQIHWYPLIEIAKKASGGKPKKKYLDATKPLLKALGTDKFRKVEKLSSSYSTKPNKPPH